MNCRVLYSTLTGNALKLATAAVESVGGAISPINLQTVTTEDLADADVLIICYWCNRGATDSLTSSLLGRLQGKRIIMLGTLGAYPDSPHGQQVLQRVRDLVEAQNMLLENFLCQGKIDPARTERRLLIPPGQPHHLDAAGYQRHLESRQHPDEADLLRAKLAVQAGLRRLAALAD